MCYETPEKRRQEAAFLLSTTLSLILVAAITMIAFFVVSVVSAHG